MKKKTWLILGAVLITVVFIVVIFAFSRGRDENASGKPVVKIGAIMSLTGGGAELGQSSLAGAQMAIKYINQNPDNKFFYKFIPEDSGMDAKKAPPLYNKLKDIDGIDAVISTSSGVGLIVKEHATGDRIFQISASTNHNVIDNQFSYIYGYDPDMLFGLLAEHLQSRGIKTIVPAAQNSSSSVYFLSFLRGQLKSHNIKIVHETLFAAGDRDFAAEVEKVKRANPDTIFLYSPEPELTLFAKALKVGGYAGQVTGAFIADYSNDKSMFNGVTFVDHAANGTEKFVADYMREFGREPLSHSAGVYDMVTIISLMIEEYGRPKDWDAAQIQPRLKEIVSDYFGANGRVFFNDEGFIHSTPVMKTIKNGKAEIVK